ncbi:MAG: NAD-dependent epimerase/dehydratase family protein [Bacteroidales bacterium]|nr:NAD-dependent epimerase/dehydratase family protein [Bacteroidales bacterium]
MYLVIGSTNILGAHTICTLLQKGYSVRAIRSAKSDMDRFYKIMSYYFSDCDNLFNEIDWVEGDPFDKESVMASLKGVDIVFNCSTPAFFGLTKDSDMVADTVESTALLVDSAKESGVKYFCHVSNVQALGDEPEFKEITEESPRDPKNKYSGFSQASFLSDMEVWRAFEEGLNGSIINTGLIIGPGDWIKDSSAIFRRIRNGFCFYTKGVTGFVGVNDVVKCMLSLSKQKICSQRFIVVSQCMSFAELLFTIADTIGAKRPYIYASKFILLIIKMIYRIKYVFSRNNPQLNDDYIRMLTNFKLYSNEKSMNSLIAGYQSIEQVVADVCEIYFSKEEN